MIIAKRTYLKSQKRNLKLKHIRLYSEIKIKIIHVSIQCIFILASNTAAPTGIFGANKSGSLFSGTKTLFGGGSLFSSVPQSTKTEDQKQSFISSGAKNEEGEGDDEGIEK